MPSEGAGRQPKYQRIAAELKAAIESGEYGPGDRLPGENDLMATYGVARMTARQALGVLQSEGLAEARKGAGVFVREFRPIRRRGHPAAGRRQSGVGAVRLGGRHGGPGTRGRSDRGDGGGRPEAGSPACSNLRPGRPSACAAAGSCSTGSR